MLVILTVATLMIPNAEALTKEQAAEQYAQREQAKLQLNETKALLPNPSLKVISIQLSKTCLYMVQHNMTTSCPTIKDLAKYDTTEQVYLGKFVEKPYYHREKSHLATPGTTLKQLTDYIICVDCPYDVLVHSKSITVTNNKLSYTKDSDKKVVNNTRYEYIGRSVVGCAFATIYYNDILLVDTINYLKNGCKESNFNEKITIKPDLIKHDITTSKAWKHKLWLGEAKKLKGINCLKSNLC